MSKFEELLNSGLIVRRGASYSLCRQSLQADRLSRVNLNEFMNISSSIAEAVYRYIENDVAKKTCYVCGARVKFINVSLGWQECCSNTCSAKKKVMTGVSIITKQGWKHTDASKQKMKLNHANFNGDNNPLRKKLKANPHLHEVLSSKAKDRWASYSKEKMDEIRSTFSKAQAESKRYKEPHYHRKNISGFFDSIKSKKKMFYRSSWELKVCEYLDIASDVISFDIEPFSIEYIDGDGIKKYTRIDFYVKTTTLEYVVEVKPKGLLNYGNNPEKIKGISKYAESNNLRFAIITEDELSRLNEIII